MDLKHVFICAIMLQIFYLDVWTTAFSYEFACTCVVCVDALVAGSFVAGQSVCYFMLG